jgi:multidrug efflux system membrane fusion protein
MDACWGTPMNMQMPPPQVGSASRWRIWLVGGVVLTALVGGYWYFSQDKAPVRRRSAVIPVRVGVVERREMPVVEHTLGTVVPFTTVQVAARVQGVIDSTSFKEGQFVKAGDLLFVIDPRPYQAAYDNALATLATSKAKADRYQKLLAQNAIAPQDEDDAQAAYLVAKSNAEAARLNLEFTHIRSPVDGKTSAIMVQTGNMVSATAMTPLVNIAQIHPIKVSFSLPQTDLPLIQARQQGAGLAATVVSQGAGGKPLSAAVDFINNAVNNVTGTIELRSTFKNEDNVLVPGQLLNVSVQLDDIPDALVVPHEAVNIGPDGNYVFALKDSKVVQKPITVLFDDGKSAAVKGDLAPGENVVTDGQLRLVSGSTVLAEGAKPVRKPGAKRGGGLKRPAGD